MPYTRISYSYADASNYKAHGEVFVEGAFTPAQITAICNKLDSSEYFIPHQVDLEPLQHQLTSFPSEDDHVWHTLGEKSFVAVDELPEAAEVACTAEELTARFERVKFWDVAGESRRLRLDEF